MKIREILESSNQVKKTRNSEYERIRLDGINVRIHVAVKATGLSAKELRSLKDKPKEEREKREKSLANKIREFQKKNLEVDHKNGNKSQNSKSNLKSMKKSDHTAKTNSTR